MRKPSPLFIAAIVLIGVLVGVGVLFHLRREAHVKTAPAHPYENAIILLNEHRPLPLQEIQKAVEESGKKVDDIRGFSGAMLYCAAKAKRQDVAQWLLAQGANPNGPGRPSTRQS